MPTSTQLHLTTIGRYPEPAGAIALERAAVNVAIPHLVGGYVPTNPMGRSSTKGQLPS